MGVVCVVVAYAMVVPAEMLRDDCLAHCVSARVDGVAVVVGVVGAVLWWALCHPPFS